MWMKWRHKWSSGSYDDWSWFDLGPVTSYEAQSLAGEACLEFANEFDYSEHYRGVEFEIAETPPVEVLRWFVVEADEENRWWAKRSIYLKNLLGKLTENG